MKDNHIRTIHHKQIKEANTERQHRPVSWSSEWHLPTIHLSPAEVPELDPDPLHAPQFHPQSTHGDGTSHGSPTEQQTADSPKATARAEDDGKPRAQLAAGGDAGDGSEDGGGSWPDRARDSPPVAAAARTRERGRWGGWRRRCERGRGRWRIRPATNRWRGSRWCFLGFVGVLWFLAPLIDRQIEMIRFDFWSDLIRYEIILGFAKGQRILWWRILIDQWEPTRAENNGEEILGSLGALRDGYI